MSLINDMLRDLEKRDVPPPAAPVTQRPAGRRAAISGRWLALAGLVAVATSGIWLIARQASAPDPVEAGSEALLAMQPRTPPEPARSPLGGSGPADSDPGAPADTARSTEPAVRDAPTSPESEGEPAPDASPAPDPTPPSSATAPDGPPPASDLKAADPAPESERSGAEPADPAGGPAAPAESRPAPAPDAALRAPAGTATGVERSEIVIRRAGGNADAVSEAVDSARRALARGRPGMAIARLEALLADRPEATEARVLLARALQATGRAGRAEELLVDGLALDPGAHRLAFWLARGQIERGAETTALETLQRHAPPVAGHGDYHLLLAATLRQLERHEAALEHYRAIAAAEPGNGRAWLGTALSLEALNRPGPARKAYRRVLDGDHPASARFARQRLAVLERANPTRQD